MDMAKFGRLLGNVTLIGAKRYLADRLKSYDRYHYVLKSLNIMGESKIHAEITKAENDFYTFYKGIEFETEKVDARYSDRYTAIFSVALKMIEKDHSEIAGCYTVFNKLNRDCDKNTFFRKNHWPRLKKWLFTKRERKESFYKSFRDQVKKLFMPIKKPQNIVDFKTFIEERSLWATSGSTDKKDRIPKGMPKTII